MRRNLVDRLSFVCPVCSWSGSEPVPLSLSVDREVAGEVVSGAFRCGNCPRRYPILDGVAVLDPEPLRSAYDEPDSLQSYLWTHYADLSHEPLDDPPPPAGDYFARLAEQPLGGLVLDLGSSVGRLAFEVSARADFVLGVERSFEAAKRAREIGRTRRVAFHLRDEGNRGRYVDFDASRLVRGNVEFVCGDAAALPLAPGVAGGILAANLVDRLRDPDHFLSRADAVLRPGGRFVLTAPFSWRPDVTETGRWLGDSVRSAREALLDWFAEHGYAVEEQAELDLTIRNHRRFFELLRPLLLRARKSV
ncbi:MAG: methyltransferase domain-containing protein [Planctomycetes bacterium]|jgi:SAM-dependent methyltransferase|nr:methyltransferase domain-containing protein [Planctomycetota bacterium]